MSKERLESLKRNKEWTEATGGKFHTVDKEDYEWLIGQAKRVRELEKDIKEWEIVNESWEEINTHLVEQNKRYLGALKFYADEKNYEDIGIPTGNNPPALPILEDRGQVARKELEGEKHGKH